MAQPDAYNRRKDFTANDGDETDHSALNNELDNAGRSINQLRDNLAKIQRDDGELANKSVGKDQLKDEAFDGFRDDLDAAVRAAQEASGESTRSATASGESARAAADSEENAARSAQNAATSAGNSARAAQALFDGIYLGPHTEDPTVDANGNPPSDGDFYYNTQAKTWRAYDAQTGRWVAPILSGQFKRVVYTAADDDFEAGVTDTLPLPGDPQTVRNIFVNMDGVHQNDGTYSVAGLDLVFDEPIPVGVQTIEVAYIEAVTIMVTDALMSFPTRASAQAAVVRIADGQAWEIRADEANGGKTTRGIVVSNALVLQLIEDYATNTALVDVANARVAKTADTGAALLPEGTDAQRPATGSIPAGVAVMRGNTQTVGDYVVEFWNRAAGAWQALASRVWVVAKINELINNAVGFTFIYPNGGSAAAPANITINTRYVLDNPFPGKHVVCETELLIDGKWGWAGVMPSVTTGSASGAEARPLEGTDGSVVIVLQTGSGFLSRTSGLCLSPHGRTGDLSAPTPCRIKVTLLKGAT